MGTGGAALGGLMGSAEGALAGYSADKFSVSAHDFVKCAEAEEAITAPRPSVEDLRMRAIQALANLQNRHNELAYTLSKDPSSGAITVTYDDEQESTNRDPVKSATRKTYSNLKEMTQDVLLTKKAILNPLPILQKALYGGALGVGGGALIAGVDAQLHDGDMAHALLRGARIGGSLGALAGAGRGYGLTEKAAKKTFTSAEKEFLQRVL